MFKSKFQRTVALSSAEAEYMALSLCVQEVLWLRAMLKDMGYEQRNATQIWEDNQGAIALAKTLATTQGRSILISSTTSHARTWRTERFKSTTRTHAWIAQHFLTLIDWSKQVGNYAK